MPVMPTSACWLHALSSRPRASMVQALSNEKVDEALRRSPPPPRLCGPWEGGLQRKERRGFKIIPPADSPTDTHSPTDTPPTQTHSKPRDPAAPPSPPTRSPHPARPRPQARQRPLGHAVTLHPGSTPAAWPRSNYRERPASGPAVTSARSFQLDDLTPHKRDQALGCGAGAQPPSG